MTAKAETDNRCWERPQPGDILFLVHLTPHFSDLVFEFENCSKVLEKNFYELTPNINYPLLFFTEILEYLLTPIIVQLPAPSELYPYHF